MGTPKVVAVSNIEHGTDERDAEGNRVVHNFTIGDVLPNDMFSEDELKALIECEAAVDTAGELQELKAVPFVDEQTAERDKLLKQSGKVVTVPAKDVSQTSMESMQAEIDRLKEQLASQAGSDAPKPISGSAKK